MLTCGLYAAEMFSFVMNNAEAFKQLEYGLLKAQRLWIVSIVTGWLHHIVICVESCSSFAAQIL
jgi:hypothetical protein